MTKLHPETAQQIADLFSSITAYSIMANDDNDNSAYWLASQYRAIVEMADQFGLFLNTYDLAIETLQNPTFRDAVLTVDKI